MSGLHHGAYVPLRQDALIVVGSGEDSDVRLSDPDLEPRHVALAIHEEQVTVRRLEGDIAVNGRKVETVDNLDISAGELLELRPRGVQLRVMTDRERQHFAATSGTTMSAQAGTELTPQPAKRKALATVAALACAALIGFLILTGNENVRADTDSVAPKTALRTMIDGLNLNDEINVDESYGRLIVRGTLATDDLALLQRKVTESPHTIILRVTTDEQLLEQVSDVFRTNGYAAKLSYSGNSKVVVENLDGASSEVQKVAEFARADVANLKELVFTPSEEPQPVDPQSAVYFATAGKRLTTIVDGETAYIATEDGARYFVGSTLPGGHYVRQITANGVQVNNGDTISWLRF
jgi:hypothetical protein